jgi:23S rRNA pseudouridine2605 synthase
MDVETGGQLGPAGPRRVQVLLAAAGLGSRRACEDLIRAGRVAVNGVVVTLGATADADRDVIAVDGQPVAVRPPLIYLALYKPPGYVTTASDERGRPAVLDLLPPQPARVFPVGRLDLDSEGLLLLTNDGELAARLMHPRYGTPREYLAWVRGTPDATALAQLRRGVDLDGIFCRPQRVTLDRSDRTPGQSLLEIVLTEGRKREVRRLCGAAGLAVQRLLRVRYGPVRLGGLQPGAVRGLSAAEVAALRRAVGLPETPGKHA